MTRKNQSQTTKIFSLLPAIIFVLIVLFGLILIINQRRSQPQNILPLQTNNPKSQSPTPNWLHTAADMRTIKQVTLTSDITKNWETNPQTKRKLPAGWDLFGERSFIEISRKVETSKGSVTTNIESYVHYPETDLEKTCKLDPASMEKFTLEGKPAVASATKLCVKKETQVIATYSVSMYEYDSERGNPANKQYFTEAFQIIRQEIK